MTMAGYTVDRVTMDQAMGQTMVMLRNAFEQVSHINQYLVNNPPVNNVDPIMTEWNYTADEAYAIRLVFQNFAADYTAQAANFQIASKLTGLA
jgi:hypothetical protein